jgi:hypothetical protein
MLHTSEIWRQIHVTNLKSHADRHNFESININCACCVWWDYDILYGTYDADREVFSESLLLVYWSMMQKRLPSTNTGTSAVEN